MTIRQPGLQDLPQLAALFDAYRQFYRQAPDPTGSAAFLRARMERGESIIHVADKDGTLAGFVQLYPLWSSTRMARLWLLNDLYVDHAHRGRGISLLLLDAAKQTARDTGATCLLLETAKDNEVGNQLYPRAGFVLDEGHNYYFWNARWA